MILYNLKCRKDHGFEAWFRDSATYDQQVEAGEVRCPVCGSKKVEKAPMAPRVSGGRSRSLPAADSPQESGKAVAMRKALNELRRHVEDNCDYVGKQFAEEARKIHYGESEERNIYGESSEDDAVSLREEGIKVQRIPWLPRENS